jgi:excisionase family DNA binding protein
MAEMAEVFTVGQVAKICKVRNTTICKWFDAGRIKGYRMPGSNDRRIPREFLIKFLNEHGFPFEESDLSLGSSPVPNALTNIPTADLPAVAGLIELLRDNMERIILEADGIGADKCPPAPHGCPKCEIRFLAKEVLATLPKVEVQS